MIHASVSIGFYQRGAGRRLSTPDTDLEYSRSRLDLTGSLVSVAIRSNYGFLQKSNGEVFTITPDT